MNTKRFQQALLDEVSFRSELRETRGQSWEPILLAIKAMGSLKAREEEQKRRDAWWNVWRLAWAGSQLEEATRTMN
jgi:hypothetical protein